MLRTCKSAMEGEYPEQFATLKEPGILLNPGMPSFADTPHSFSIPSKHSLPLTNLLDNLKDDYVHSYLPYTIASYNKSFISC